MEVLCISGVIASSVGFVLANFFLIFAYIENAVRKRKDMAYILIAFFFFGSSMAALGQTMLYFFPDSVATSNFWERFQHIGLFVLTPVWIHFIYYYFLGRRFSFTIGFIYVYNLVGAVLVLTTHLLFMPEPRPFKDFLTFAYGPLYTPMLGALFVFILVAFIQTAAAFRSTRHPLRDRILFVTGSAIAYLTALKDLLETWWETPLPQLFPYGLLVAAFLYFAIILLHIRDMDREYDRQKDMEHELITAQNIQRHFVPPRLEVDNWHYQLAAVNRPGQYLGGDFYQVIQYSPHEFLFYIGDVTGKGVGASLYMSLLVGYFKSLPRVNSAAELDSVANTANLYMKNNSRENMFVTLFIGLADLKTAKLHFINAGHLRPPLFSGIGRKGIQLLNTPGMPLGIEADQRYVHDTVDLHTDDLLCLYTDGLSEPFEQSGVIGGEEYLHNLVKLRIHSPPGQIVDAILEEHDRIKPLEPLSDDLSLMIIKLKTMA